MAKLISRINALLAEYAAHPSAALNKLIGDLQFMLYMLIKQSIKGRAKLAPLVPDSSWHFIKMDFAFLILLAKALGFLDEDPLTTEGQQALTHEINQAKKSFGYPKELDPFLQKIDELHQQKIDDWFKNHPIDDGSDYTP